jgi:SPP1 gp7 family putative phage head morphogenesis protein
LGGEDQLKTLIRQGFALQNVADRAVLDVDALLGRVMLNVRKLIEQLQEESLLRGRAWKDLQPIVKLELEPYAQGLKQAVTQQQVTGAPGMQDFARREAELAGAKLTSGLGAPTQASVIDQLNRARVGKARFRELFTPKQGPITPWTQTMFRVVDTKVRAGMIEGLTTQQIADQVVHETISRGVPGVSLQGKTAVRTIRAQSMAMTRTVTQEMSRQIRDELYDANKGALKGFVYLFTSALDSRTCPSCAPLDGQRYESKSKAPTTPLHVNCRCSVLLIDPEDEFWDETKRTGQQISETPYKTGYKTKVKVKGDQFYRKAVEFNGTDYSDYLASSNMTTQTEFFGGGRIGERRARYFRSQIDKVNKDPQDILASMLTGPSNAKKFIPLP